MRSSPLGGDYTGNLIPTHSHTLVSDWMRHALKVREIKLKMVTCGTFAKHAVICNHSVIITQDYLFMLRSVHKLYRAVFTLSTLGEVQVESQGNRDSPSHVSYLIEASIS